MFGCLAQFWAIKKFSFLRPSYGLSVFILIFIVNISSVVMSAGEAKQNLGFEVRQSELESQFIDCVTLSKLVAHNCIYKI